ncbi:MULTISPECIES: DUF4179 domain-containing protein [Tissierellales]|nr:MULTISPECIES: DUF4179 domain-containing protein [Tissierellales]SCL82715.1 hypothetical protein PP176A_0315 [Sporanaerobacter sp. PP17-6a]
MKKSKNMYELINNMEFNLEGYEIQELSDIEKQNLKNNFKKKKLNFKKIVTVAAALVLTVGIFSQTETGKYVYAAFESKVSKISYSIGKSLGIERNIEPYSNVVGQVREDNGVEVKLGEVIIDKDELIFSTIVNANKPVEFARFDTEIFINGEKLTNYSMSGTGGAIDDSQETIFMVDSVDVKGIELNKDVDINIILRNMNYFDGKDEKKISGKWEFEFTANGDELAADTYTLPMNYSFNIDNLNYNLEEFRYNPVNQKIIGKIRGESDKDYELDLRGQDNLGNKVVFSLRRMSDKNFILAYENIYGDLSDKAASVTLTPYAREFPKKSGKVSGEFKKVGESFTINLKSKTK